MSKSFAHVPRLWQPPLYDEWVRDYAELAAGA